MKSGVPSDHSPTPLPPELPRRSFGSPGKGYRSGVRWLMASGIVTLLGVGGWYGYQQFLQPKQIAVAVTLLPVQLGDVEVTITESGTVELAGQQTAKAPGEVTVEQVLVKERQMVEAGQTLIMLRDRAAQEKFQQQQVENKKFAIDLARKQEAVAEKRARLRIAEKRLKDSQELFQRGYISEDDLQTDKDRLEDVRAALKDAQTEQAKALVDVQYGDTKLKEIQQQLGDRLVTAPIAALVLSVKVKPGDGVKTETELLTLGDPTKELVQLQLTTLNAAKVRVNQGARVSQIGPDPKTFQGRVADLAPQATAATSSEFGSQPQAKVDAAVVLDRPSNVLIPGSQVSVEIVLEQRRNAVTIPTEAIQPGDRPFVWLRDAEGKAVKREIGIGLQGLTTVEVTHGLKVGDAIALVPPTQTLAPGTLLTVEAQPRSRGAGTAADAESAGGE